MHVPFFPLCGTVLFGFAVLYIYCYILLQLLVVCFASCAGKLKSLTLD